MIYKNRIQGSVLRLKRNSISTVEAADGLLTAKMVDGFEKREMLQKRTLKTLKTHDLEKKERPSIQECDAGASRFNPKAFPFNHKECVMSPQQNPVLETLLSDPLIQTIMRADRVEPKSLRSLIHRVASARGLHHEDIRPSFLGTPSRSGPLQYLGEACGAALCC